MSSAKSSVELYADLSPTASNLKTQLEMPSAIQEESAPILGPNYPNTTL
jgi:hypothetical protein